MRPAELGARERGEWSECEQALKAAEGRRAAARLCDAQADHTPSCARVVAVAIIAPWRGSLATRRLPGRLRLLLAGFLLFFHAKLLRIFLRLGLVLPAFISDDALIFLHEEIKRSAAGGSDTFNRSRACSGDDASQSLAPFMRSRARRRHGRWAALFGRHRSVKRHAAVFASGVTARLAPTKTATLHKARGATALQAPRR
jgi:hypothetical protein